MARVSRRELKRDEFISTFEETWEFLRQQRDTIVALVLAVLLGAGTLGGFYWHSRRQEQRASTALGEALAIYSAPIRPNPAEVPPGLPRPSFDTEPEKYEAAREAFVRLRQNFPRTHVAVIAKHYEALALWHLERREKALKLLEEVSQAGNPERAALAQLHLAGFYLQLGRTEEARQLYQKLADHPCVSVPRPTALLALADLYAASQPGQARKLYDELRQEFADTPLATQINRRLEMLPPAK